MNFPASSPRRLPVIVCLALLSSTLASAGHSASPMVNDSGFMTSYEQLLPTADDPQVRMYRKSEVDLGAYDKLLVEDLQFLYAEDSTFKDYKPGELQRIRDESLAALRKSLAGRFAIVTEPAPGVIRLRAAITGIRARKKAKNLLSITPVGLLKQGIEAATGTNVLLMDAAAEIELCDALTGERLLAMVDGRAGDEPSRKKDRASWGEVQATLDALANRLATGLDASATRPLDR